MSKQTDHPKYRLAGVDIDKLTIAEATELIVNRAKAAGSPPDYVVKPYVEFLDAAQRDPALASLLNGAWLTLPDSISLLWAAHYQYGGKRGFGRWLATIACIVVQPSRLTTPLPERFAGITATSALLEAASLAGLRVFLIGSPKNSTIEHTADVLRQLWPGLIIAGTHPGTLAGLRGPQLIRALSDSSPEAELAATLETARADLILVGMGFPLQEKLAAKLCQQLSHGIIVGEGGSFDYRQLGGQEIRAPRLMQKLGLEWFWRLLQEPSRLQRQLAIPRFLWHIYRHSDS